MKVRGRITRIGNSLGIVIPSDQVKRHGLREGDIVQLDVEKRVNVHGLFGPIRLSKTAQELKDETRRDWGD